MGKFRFWNREKKRLKKDLHKSKKKIKKRKKKADEDLKRIHGHPINKYFSLGFFTLTLLLLISSIVAGSPLLFMYLLGTLYISVYAYKKARI